MNGPVVRLGDHPAYRLVSDHARALARRIAGEVAADLEEIREPLLAGEDSVLSSVWQEICAQAQGEESFYWDAYRQTMRDAVRVRLQAIPATEREMLWLCSEPGWDWLWDVVNADDEPPPGHPGVDESAIAEWIVAEFVLDLAQTDEHPNVERFLWSGSVDDCPGDDDSDQDDEVRADGDGSNSP